MGRVMYVGDPNQAIYHFSGSDASAMPSMAEYLRETRQGLVSLPLTVTRRCPLLVTAYARRLVPNFECLPNAPLGAVCLGSSTLTSTPTPQDRYAYTVTPYPSTEKTFHYHDGPTPDECTPQCFTDQVPGLCQDNEAKRGDMILCRVNAPLVQQAYKFIRANIPCTIQGKDIGRGLADQIKKLVPSTASVEELEVKLGAWYDKQYAYIMKNFANSETRLENAMAALQDKKDCIEALMEGLRSVQEVLSRIEVLFADVQKGNTDGFVLLSTIHKAKGLEARTVRIIMPEMLGILGRTPTQKQQEKNLEYVAISRSLNALHIHNLAA